MPIVEDDQRSRRCLNYPDSLDWRTKGVISPVKNQGVVGQVSAIVAVGKFESTRLIKFDYLKLLHYRSDRDVERHPNWKIGVGQCCSRC